MDGGPTFQYGDMFQTAWNRPGTLFVVTGNSSINRHGELVMGRGAAKQLKMRVNGIAQLLGEVLTKYHMNMYGLCVVPSQRMKERLGHWCRVFCDVGVFQVKTRFSNRAEPTIIRHSVAMLERYARENPSLVINMNMPGTGFGHLSEGAVLPYLERLPKTVNIWRFAHEAPRVTTVVNDEPSDQD
jgi:hypothetical protein